jgi:hypothetical protein
MPKPSLSEEELALLRRIVAARRADLVMHLDALESSSTPDKIYDELQLAVAGELAQSGLGADDEPNVRGRMLDEIIGKIGRLRDAR